MELTRRYACFSFGLDVLRTGPKWWVRDRLSMSGASADVLPGGAPAPPSYSRQPATTTTASATINRRTSNIVAPPFADPDREIDGPIICRS